jgi:CheY-like chemotaxis protein
MLRVLIIDDDKTFLDTVRLILEFEGFRVFVATTAADGVALAQKQQPHVVICDFILPKASGQDVAFALRNDPMTQDIPIILLSGWEHDPAGKTAERADVSQYLMKPIAAHELLKHIRRLIGSANSNE